MEIRRAKVDDTELLIQLRIDFLQDMHPLTAAEEEAIRKSLRGHFAKHIPAGTCIAMLAFERDEAVSVAYLSICEKPANRSWPTGITATLLNVWTHPDYRRRGLATQLIRALIDEARQAGVSNIDLSATEEGRPVYEKLGFEVSTEHTEMRLKLSS